MLPEHVRSAVEVRRGAGLLSGHSTTDAYRLVHGRHDRMEGWTIDKLGPVANLRVRPQAEARQLLDELLAVANQLIEAEPDLGIDSVFVTIDESRKDTERTHEGLENAAKSELRARGQSPPESAWNIRENGHRYRVSSDSGFSYGIFLDMRDVRAELARRWTSGDVANLFAYTCAFSVPLADQCNVWNVDVSQRYLDWGRDNHRLNGIYDGVKFMRRDAFAFLEFAVERGITYDALIIDPPVFSHGKRGLSRRFRIARDLEALVALGLRALRPGGELFISTNLAGLGQGEFRSRVASCAAEHGAALQKQWTAAPDFPVPPSRYHLKTALITV